MKGVTPLTKPSSPAFIPNGFKRHDGNSFRPSDCTGDNLLMLRGGQEVRSGHAFPFWVWDARAPHYRDVVGYIPDAPKPLNTPGDGELTMGDG